MNAINSGLKNTIFECILLNNPQIEREEKERERERRDREKERRVQKRGMRERESKGDWLVLPVPKKVLVAPIGLCARPNPEPGRAAHPPFGPIGPARGASGRRSEAGPWT
jgi:hypothetical protein